MGGIAARLAVSAASGWCWGQGPVLLAFVPFVYAAYWHARCRREAFCVAWLYHVVACRSLIMGGARFFALSLPLSFLLVALCAALVGAIWALVWKSAAQRTVVRTVVRTLALMALTILPPLGALAVPHPLSAAGIWFPGLGWWGLALTIVAAAVMASRRWGLPPCIVIALVALIRFPDQSPAPAYMSAVQTMHGVAREEVFDFQRHWFVATAAQRAARASTSPIVLLPENAGGLWSAPMRALWAPTGEALRARSQSVLIGVTEGGVSEPLFAGAKALGVAEGSYRQRAPLPLAMWRPWESAFAPRWFAAGTMALQGHRVGIFICWEIGVTWCVLQSVLEGADSLVVLANTAWLRGTTAGQAQAQLLVSWGALFDLPILSAANT